LTTPSLLSMCLDNAFALIEGHPGRLKMSQRVRHPPAINDMIRMNRTISYFEVAFLANSAPKEYATEL
jgi:hypothetical protein